MNKARHDTRVSVRPVSCWLAISYRSATDQLPTAPMKAPGFSIVVVVVVAVVIVAFPSMGMILDCRQYQSRGLLGDGTCCFAALWLDACHPAREMRVVTPSFSPLIALRRLISFHFLSRRHNGEPLGNALGWCTVLYMSEFLVCTVHTVFFRGDRSTPRRPRRRR